MIDTHAHLDMPEFDSDRNEVITRAHNAGANTIITVGIDLPSSRQAMALAEQNEGIYAAVGFHPQDAGKMEEHHLDELVEMSKIPKVVAIGEIGLDYFHKYAPEEKQIEVLQWQLDLAGNLKLPVVIHCRQAISDMLPVLKKWTSAFHDERSPGVIHCFNGSDSDAKSYLEMGFYISLGAYIGYPSSRMQDVIRAIPEDRLLLETDCPFLPPQNHRGKRNEPAYVAETLKVLASIRNENMHKVEEVTDKNARDLFGLE